MKHLILWSMIAVAVAGLPAAEPAAKAVPASRAVLAPVKRLDTLKLAARVLAPRETTWKTTAAALPDPFYRKNLEVPETKVVVEETDRRPERSDADLLAEASRSIRPTGTFMVGTENYLLLGGTRYKNGDVLSVTIDGIVHAIVLSDISRNSYTLRLNQTESQLQLK